MKDFNELFDDFMNDNSNKKRNEDPDMMANLFKKLSNLNFLDKDNVFKELDGTLGEPHELKNYEENGVFYQKQIWNTKHGKVIKTVVSDMPFKDKGNVTKKTRIPLELQLEEAVTEENYELAAKLRDRIAKREEKKAKK